MLMAPESRLSGPKVRQQNWQKMQKLPAALAIDLADLARAAVAKAARKPRDRSFPRDRAGAHVS